MPLDRIIDQVLQTSTHSENGPWDGSITFTETADTNVTLGVALTSALDPVVCGQFGGNMDVGCGNMNSNPNFDPAAFVAKINQ
jgi:hypothetical protein